MTNNATGERKKQILLINQVQRINASEFTTVKIKAFFLGIMPAGISLLAVRGFKASIGASRYLLKAMAALRANTIQHTTNINLFISSQEVCGASGKNPLSAFPINPVS